MPSKKLLLISVIAALLTSITAPIMAQGIEYITPNTAPQQDDEITCCECLTCQIDVLPPARSTPDVPVVSCITATVEGVDKRICCYQVTATYQIKNQCRGYCWDNDYYYGSATYTAEHTPCGARCVLFNHQRIFPLILKWR